MNPQTQIDILKLEKAVAELEAQWLQRKERLKVIGQEKNFILKVNNTDVQIGFWIFSFIGTVLLYLVSFINNGGLIVGLFLLAVWGFDIFQTKNKVKFYEEQKALYESQKAGLIAQIQQLKDTPQ